MELLALVPVVVAVAWAVGYAFLQFASPRELLVGYGSEADLERVIARPGARALVEQLEQLGFHRLGARHERLGPLARAWWAIDLASERGDCFATVAGPSLILPAHAYYLSAFERGTVVLTDGSALTPAVETKRLVIVRGPVANLLRQRAEGPLTAGAGVPLSVLLQVHRAAVERRVQTGERLLEASGREGRLAACRAYYATPWAVRQRRTTGAILLALLATGGLVAWYLLAGVRP